MELNYEGMAKLANTSPSNFLRMPHRYEDKISKYGMVFKKCGIGKSAVYDVEWKNFNDMEYDEKFYFLFGEFPTNSELSKLYMSRIYLSYDFYKYKTDKELCKYLKVHYNQVNKFKRIREQFTRIGLMVDIKHTKYNSKYYKRVGKKRIEIEYKEYARMIDIFDFYSKYFKSDSPEKDLRYKIEDAKMIVKEVDSPPIRVRARVMTKKFFTLQPYLFGKFTMSEELQKSYEIYGYQESFFKKTLDTNEYNQYNSI